MLRINKRWLSRILRDRKEADRWMDMRVEWWECWWIGRLMVRDGIEKGSGELGGINHFAQQL
jgi:hypothetical protein